MATVSMVAACKWGKYAMQKPFWIVAFFNYVRFRNSSGGISGATRILHRSQFINGTTGTIHPVHIYWDLGTVLFQCMRYLSFHMMQFMTKTTSKECDFRDRCEPLHEAEYSPTCSAGIANFICLCELHAGSVTQRRAILLFLESPR